MNIVEIGKKAGKEFENSELGTLCLTCFGEEIVKIVQNDPISIAKYEADFIEMWNAPKEIPFELISLCMYHLKLPEFRKYIQQYRNLELSKDNWRAESPTRSVLSAYNEKWEDYELFYEKATNKTYMDSPHK